MFHQASAPMRRLALLSGICLIALLAFAGAASAASITTSGSTVTFTGAAGEFNNISVTYQGTNTFVLVDNGVGAITVGGSCTQNATTSKEADCSGTFTSLVANLGDQDDYLDATDVNSSLVVTANGGTGYDELTGGDAADVLNGDDDGDVIYPSPGADTENGGAGDDWFDMGGGATSDGNDTIDGGSGTDFVDYEYRDNGVTVNLTGGVDSISATTGNGQSGENDSIKNVDGAGGSITGPNTLTGNSGPNDLYGGEAADTLNGNAGDDYLPGDLGTDTLNGGDGGDFLDGSRDADVLNGGNGDDYLYGGRGPGDQLNGGDGNDDLDGGTDLSGATPGGDGSDAIDGGPGSDWVDYYDRTAPVTINLTGGVDTINATTTNGEAGENDSIKNVENTEAGEGADTITGNSQANVLLDAYGPGDNIDALGGNDEIDDRDAGVDSDNCGDGTDVAYVDVAGQFGDPVSDIVTGCESVNPDYTPPAPQPPPSTGTTTPPPATTTTPPVTTTPPPPPVITANVFLAKIQQSPKADTITGSASIPADGSSLVVQVLYNGKLAKVTVIGKLTKKGLKQGSVPFKVKLNTKAAKLARKKGKKGLKVTVKATIKPPTGSSTNKQFKVTVRKGKSSACFRTASAHAHAAC